MPEVNDTPEQIKDCKRENTQKGLIKRLFGLQQLVNGPEEATRLSLGNNQTLRLFTVAAPVFVCLSPHHTVSSLCGGAERFGSDVWHFPLNY